MQTGNEAPGRCERCADGGRVAFPYEITMAFQPIVDMEQGKIYAHEALVRGKDGQSAGKVLGDVDEANRYAFDQKCRITAIELAARLKVAEYISINFMPNAVYEPANCISATLRAAQRTGFPVDRIIFEITEGEEISDMDHVRHIIAEYRRFGFRTAIDDFGSGFAGLSLLADLQPDLLKIDMRLIRGIDQDTVRQSIVQGICATAGRLGITVIAEGIETVEERDLLISMGITLHQGFLYARPQFEKAIGADGLEGLRA